MRVFLVMGIAGVMISSSACASIDQQYRKTNADFVMGDCTEEVDGTMVTTSCDEVLEGSKKRVEGEGNCEYSAGCKEHMEKEYKAQAGL